jgi:hypothetical protein
MRSGVYCLTFKDGSQYIGKSVDCESRYKDHINTFNKKTASKKMQEAYDVNGQPKMAILQYCHVDHVDLMETYYIGKLSPTLNSVLGIKHDDEIVEVLENHNGLLDKSTCEHMAEILKSRERITTLETIIDVAKSMTEVLRSKEKIAELENTLETAKSIINKLKVEIKRTS